MTTTEIPTIDQAQLEAFVGQAVTDMGAAISGLLLRIGDRLGLYKAMAGAGPVTSAELARRTGTTERYVREWLGNQAAGGYVVYDPAEHTYRLPAEHAMVLANEESPVFMAGAFETIASCYADQDVFVDAFRTGAGVGWLPMMQGCSRGWCDCSDPGTPPTWSMPGCPCWTGWSTSCEQAGAWPMSGTD